MSTQSTVIILLAFVALAFFIRSRSRRGLISRVIAIAAPAPAPPPAVNLKPAEPRSKNGVFKRTDPAKDAAFVASRVNVNPVGTTALASRAIPPEERLAQPPPAAEPLSRPRQPTIQDTSVDDLRAAPMNTQFLDMEAIAGYKAAQRRTWYEAEGKEAEALQAKARQLADDRRYKGARLNEFDPVFARQYKRIA